MKKIIFLLALVACSSLKSISTRTKVEVKEEKVDLSNSFYILPAKNFGEYENSGYEAGVAMKSFLDEYAKSVYLTTKSLNLDEGITDAKNNNSKYLITIEINNWKDANDVLCGLVPFVVDRLEVFINVYDVNSKKLVNRQSLKNNTCPIKVGALGIPPIVSLSTGTPGARLYEGLVKWRDNINENK